MDEGTLRLTFPEAIAALKSKLPLGSTSWKTYEGQLQDVVFSVAGITKASLLADIQNLIVKQLETGITVEGFKKNFDTLIDKSGWNPANRGYRTELILQQNLKNAHARGRWEQMRSPAIAKTRKYWEWRHRDSRVPRPHHLAQDGKVYPADADLWKAIFPPPFGCFTEGTLVATEHGWKPIESIRAGDRVIGGSGNLQNVGAVHKLMYSDQVIRVACKGIGETFATPNHRFLTLRGWIRADNLTVDDVLIQTPKLAAKNTRIGNKDQVNTLSCNSFIPRPVQGESSVPRTLDSDPQVRQVKIDPIKSNDVIKHNVEMHSLQMHHQRRFRFRRKSLAIQVLSRLNMNAQSRMRVFRSDLIQHLSSLFFPRIIINPLMSDGLTSVSRLNSAVTHQPRQHSVSNSPAIAQLTTSHPFFNIKLLDGFLQRHFFGNFNRLHNMVKMPVFLATQRDVKMTSHIVDGGMSRTPLNTDFAYRHSLLHMEEPQGFVSGAPLDFFNSLEQFSVWAINSAGSHRITALASIDYTGSVYDITVDVDASYCLIAGIVHNCRCTAHALSDRDLERLGLTVSEPPALDTIAEKGFDQGFSDLPKERDRLLSEAKQRLPPEFADLLG